jgi:hypothetical protein
VQVRLSLLLPLVLLLLLQLPLRPVLLRPALLLLQLLLRPVLPGACGIARG